MESKIVLYHSNEEKKCINFVEKNNLIISGNSKDDIWLGKGMYFWDNLGNAKWWNGKQKNRCPSKRYIIVVANVIINNLLDLTDRDVCDSVEDLWENFCEDNGLNPKIELGAKLNILFEALDMGKKYDLIKVYGKYNNNRNKGLFTYDFKSRKAEPTMGVRCIYNVRNKNCIIEKEL